MVKRYKHPSQRRKTRVRAKIRGTTARPRLTVFRSGQNIYAQIIDDSKGITLAAANSLKLKKKAKIETAQAVGETIAKAAQKKKIHQVVFDRGAYKYHGRIKALAEAARKLGLKF
jgi:large subunit ribosomal protein L18